MENNLFWYPALNSKFDFDKPLPKGDMLNSYILYDLARLQSMFKYDGLPKTIPQKWLEHYLLVNGSCVFIKDGEDLIATTGGMGGLPDRYYIPTQYIVSNPYVKPETRKTYTIGTDSVLMRNDTYSQGILPLLTRYDSQLVENDVTMNIADILARAMLTMSATDTQTKESIEKWLADLRKGKLSAIGELPAMLGNQDRSLNITPFQQVAAILTDLIEYHQYLKAGKYNELGLNANYNMKRESINSNESQLNDDMLYPLIDDMLASRREALEEVNAMFGTNITVEFNSAWETNEIEEDLTLETMESQAESVTEGSDDMPGDTSETVETSDDLTEGEEVKEDVIDETEETPDDTSDLDDVEKIVDAIETAAEVIADAVEGDTEETDEQEDKE